MLNWKKGWLLACFMMFAGAVCLAQPQTLLQEADRQLALHAYGRSIELYTQLLSDFGTALKPEQRIAAQANLAFSYKAAGDLQKAETTYRDLVSGATLTGERVIHYLHFAQVLASNGKYRESQSMFEKYNGLKSQQTDRRSATLAPQAVGQAAPGTKKTPTKYRLEVLDLNTSNAEFSPMYFRDGLLFVSGKKGGSTIETSGSGGGGGYLDLYYIPNRQELKIDKIIKADGSVTKAPPSAAPKKERSVLGGDYYTRATANDTRTPGYDGGYRVTDGLGYKPNTVQRFDKDINTRYHEGPATFFSDGSRIIFTRNNYNGGRVRQSAEGVTNLKLYSAEQQNGAWVNVQELPINSNEYSVGHPALSKDDKLLFFASDMPGGLGGTDLYVSRYSDGKWSKPVNLGRQINTKGNELFPFVDEQGNLYFASDGQKGGLGGLDVYCAYMTNGTQATQIEHLEAPVNSPQDDFGLITDEYRRTGFLSTNRFNGSDDIVRFVRESSLYGCRNLTLRLYDEETNQPLDSVTVEIQSRTEGQAPRTLLTKATGLAQLCLEGNTDFIIRSSKDGFMTSTVGFSTQGLTDDSPSRLEIALFRPKELADTVQLIAAVASSRNDGWGVVDPKKSRIRGVVMSERDRKPIEGVVVRLKNECDGMVQQVVTGADGRYEFELTENCEFTLIAAKERYGTNTNRIRKLPRKTPPKVLSADLKMLRVGDIVELDNIYYDLDKWTIRPDAARELDKLVATMRKYPTLSVEIRSHTDSRGDNTYNRYLSAQRASSVVNYLASKGISRNRLVAAGYGETMPVNNCVDGVICTEAEYQRNRRTEFKVLAIK